MQPGEQAPSPGLRRILTSLSIPPSSSVLSCEAAASMDVNVFGDRTEDVREWVFHELAARADWGAPRAPSGPWPVVEAHAVPATSAACSVAAASSVVDAHADSAMSTTWPVVGAHTVSIAAVVSPVVDAHAAAATAQPLITISAAAPTSANSCTALVVPTMLPLLTSSAASSAAHAAGELMRTDVLASEQLDIERAVAEFIGAVPAALLLHTPSALPDAERVDTRRRHLLTCGASSVRAGTAFVREWLRFCERRALVRFGLPVDADLMNAFLADVDAAARRRSAGHKSRTGSSVQHAMACAARWTSDHAGLPFDAAKLPTVRKSSAPVREREPRWAEMWEPAVLVHLLRVAIDNRQRGLVRATAAAVYLVCAASMRLVNGLRSAPPIIDESLVFHGVAVLSKGRRRSSMAPSPWSVPCVSPDGSITDSEVALGLQTALSHLPPDCCSMFPQLHDDGGRAVALERAVGVYPAARASSTQLETSVTFLLTLPPLAMSRAEARKVASRKHGPRHIMPEVARVMGLPVSARHELGMWADPDRAMACWQRSVEECSSGLILGPFTASQLNQPSSSGFPALGYGRWRPLPRFAIKQKGKWRCIDDGAASRTNCSGMSTCETIVCDRPDSPLRIGLRFHELGPPPLAPSVPVTMGGGTDDKFAASRAVPTLHPGYTTVMVARPASAAAGGWDECFFRVPGHNFGLASAVLNFYHVAEPPTVFSRLFFGTPVTRYYDDHGVHEPSYAAGSGQECHFALHELLRFHFDFSKHAPWARAVVYTGVRTDWSRDTKGLVSVGVSRSRRDSVRSIITDALASGTLSPAAASSLRGKARFCLCPVFGRVGLAAVHLLGRRQSSDGVAEIDEALREVLLFLDVVVDKLPDFEVRFRRTNVLPSVVVLSDASWETNHSWLGFLVLCPLRGAVWAGSPTPAWLLSLLKRHKAAGTYIGQLELAAAAAPYFSLPCSWWRQRCVMHYIDNQGACYSLIHGRASDADANRLVFVMSMHIALLRCDVWYDYVPSASNIADLPTRLDASAFSRLEAVARRIPLSLPPEWCLACGHSELAKLFE